MSFVFTLVTLTVPSHFSDLCLKLVKGTWSYCGTLYSDLAIHSRRSHM